MKCENSTYRILPPTCLGSEATHRVTIAYSEVENDELLVCEPCGKNLVKDGRRHGYGCTMRPIEEGEKG